MLIILEIIMITTQEKQELLKKHHVTAAGNIWYRMAEYYGISYNQLDYVRADNYINQNKINGRVIIG